MYFLFWGLINARWKALISCCGQWAKSLCMTVLYGIIRWLSAKTDLKMLRCCLDQHGRAAILRLGYSRAHKQKFSKGASPRSRWKSHPFSCSVLCGVLNSGESSDWLILTSCIVTAQQWVVDGTGNEMWIFALRSH